MFSKAKFLPCMLLLVSAIFSSCLKDLDSPYLIEDPYVDQTVYHFSAKLDGQPLSYKIDTLGNAEMSHSTEVIENPPLCRYSYGCTMSTSGSESANTSNIRIYFPDLFVGNCSEMNQVFSGSFHTGLYDFGVSHGGVIISYWDGTQMWTSEPDVQENSTFQVTDSRRLDTWSGTFQKVSGKASCVLTNAIGETKKLEEITFILSFSPN